MCCSQLLEEIEELRWEMHSLYKSDDVCSSLLEISQKLDDLIIRYYRYAVRYQQDY